MAQFSSRPPFNTDPAPYVVTLTKRTPFTNPMTTGSVDEFLREDERVHDPRPQYERPQHNPTNPILARFRKWVEDETLADPSWATEWVAAMDDPDRVSDAADVLDELYEAPYRRKQREAEAQHARRVISRLAALGDAS